MGVQIQGDTGNVIATKGTYSGDVSIGGTLTYEDVTNIDSVGLITARQGIEIGTGVGVAASISVDGNAEFAGIVTASTSVSTLAKVGGGVTISESGIEASGVGITCANLNGGQFGRRNLIINGAMQVAQRGNADSVTSDYGGADRFLFNRSGAAVVTLRQQGVGNSPTDQGFGFCQQIDVTTADSSLASDDYARISYRFEGQDLQLLKKGTANAQEVTLSFYIKSPKTGTHIVELLDQTNSRHVNLSYTVSSANTWEKKTLTFPADTTGTITNDNARRMDLNWYLAAGSTYSSGTLQTTWGSNTNANRAVGQVNCMDSTDNNVYITGVQLELGSQATAFEHRRFAEELASCQRYCYVTPYGGSSTSSAGSEETVQGSFAYNSGDDQNVRATIQFPQPMRLTPTFTGSSTNLKFRSSNTSTNFHASGLSSFLMKTASNVLSMNLTVTLGSPASIAGSSAGTLEFNAAGGFLKFESEL